MKEHMGKWRAMLTYCPLDKLILNFICGNIYEKTYNIMKEQ